MIPYFAKYIKPRLVKGENVIISAHGNSLRALIMYLEDLTPEEILKVELPTARPIIYNLEIKAEITSKEVIDIDVKT